MEVNKLKELGVLALVLIPLSLSGCSKNSEDAAVEDVSSDSSVSVESDGEVVAEGGVSDIPPTEPSTPSTPNNMKFEEGVEVVKDAELHFIPVGLGESVLFRDGNDYMLIDAGGNKGATINYLKNIGVSKLKYLVLTQWDYDSTTDVESILNTYQVDYIVAPEIQSTAHKDAKKLNNLMSKTKGLHISYPNNREIEYKIGGSYFSCLNRLAKNNTEDDNSLGIYINVYGTKVFISSDASTNQDEVKQLGNIDIYSVARHGDSSINTEERINTLKPKYSVIPTNGVTIDHSGTEKLLKSVGSKVHKTVDGAVIYKITDNGIEVNR